MAGLQNTLMPFQFCCGCLRFSLEWPTPEITLHTVPIPQIIPSITAINSGTMITTKIKLSKISNMIASFNWLTHA